MIKLIFFDIDGTLLNVRSDIMRSIIHSIFQSFDLQVPDMDEIPFAGRTDYAIFNSIIEASGGTKLHFNRIKKAYLQTLDEQLKPEDVDPTPFAYETLDYFTQQNIHLALLTGNFRESAYTKLHRGKMDHYFPFGSFGSSHENRNHLPEIGIKKFKKRYNQPVANEEIAIIGDTPYDIRCAKFAGVRSIAVSTGHYSASALKKEEPDLLLDNLNNPSNWMYALN